MIKTTSNFILEVRALADALETVMNESTSEAEYYDLRWKALTPMGMQYELAELTYG